MCIRDSASPVTRYADFPHKQQPDDTVLILIPLLMDVSFIINLMRLQPNLFVRRNSCAHTQVICISIYFTINFSYFA